MIEAPTERKRTMDTPWLLSDKHHVCQQIAARLPVYREAGWPVDEMDAQIHYVPHSRLALWRLVSAQPSDEGAP
jgi:hypothetical protein